jgi:hypothetical protein
LFGVRALSLLFGACTFAVTLVWRVYLCCHSCLARVPLLSLLFGALTFSIYGNQKRYVIKDVSARAKLPALRVWGDWEMHMDHEQTV